MIYPIQPTARVGEPVETSSGRAPRHFHYSLHVRAGTSCPEAFPFSYRDWGRPTSESTAPNILQRPERRTKWGSPLLDMCGTCLSILSTDGFSGYLAKLARAEQRYFANLWSINTESEPARVLARTSVSIQCYACRGNPRDSIKSNAEDIKMRITLRLFMTVTRELCICILPSFYKGKQVRAARQPLSKLC